MGVEVYSDGGKVQCTSCKKKFFIPLKVIGDEWLCEKCFEYKGGKLYIEALIELGVL